MSKILKLMLSCALLTLGFLRTVDARDEPADLRACKPRVVLRNLHLEGYVVPANVRLESSFGGANRCAMDLEPSACVKKFAERFKNYYHFLPASEQKIIERLPPSLLAWKLTIVGTSFFSMNLASYKIRDDDIFDIQGYVFEHFGTNDEPKNVTDFEKHVEVLSFACKLADEPDSSFASKLDELRNKK